MKKFIAVMLKHWAGSPLKIIMTLLSVGVGTGVLILSLSAGMVLKEEITGKLEANGLVLYVTNGEWDSDGSISRTMPPELDSLAPSVLVSDSDSIDKTAVIWVPPFHDISADGKTYTLRQAVSTEPGYFEIFGLEITEGVPMTADDLALGARKVWISEELAEILYGSASEAVGRHISPPGNVLSRGPGGRRDQNMIINYLVAGVFASPSEVVRKSYGIGDLVLPYTSMLTSGRNSRVMIDMVSGNFAAHSTESSVNRVSAGIRQTLASVYGDDADILVWEGTPSGESSYMNELRQSVNIFSITVNILGTLLLVISSLGIFSIMVVESVNRRKEIALERALGASGRVIIKEFWGWSLALSMTGALLGAGLAFIFAAPVLGSLSPLLGDVSYAFKNGASVRGQAVLIGMTAALIFGGLIGVIPAFSAVRGNISETIRES